jgi:cobalt/nickel transport system permease protein
MKFSLSPLISTALIIILAMVIAIADNFLKCSGIMAVLIILLIVHQWDGRRLIERLALINVFSFFICFTFAISMKFPGSMSLYQIFFMLNAPLLLCLKLNLLAAAFFILFDQIDVSQLASIMNSLAIPAPLSLLIISSWRNISTIEKQYRTLKLAAELRCYRSSLSRHTYETIGYHIGMTLVRSWLRTSTINNAMLLRGFSGELPVLKEYRTTSGNIVFLTVCGSLALIPLTF